MYIKIRKKLAILIMLISVIFANASFADLYKSNIPLYKPYIVKVPAGTEISAFTSTTLDPEYLTIGQTVVVHLGSFFYYGSAGPYHGSNLIAEPGSLILGNVTRITKAKYGSDNAALELKFTKLITIDGYSQAPISAIVKTADNTGILKGKASRVPANAPIQLILIGPFEIKSFSGSIKY